MDEETLNDSQYTFQSDEVTDQEEEMYEQQRSQIQALNNPEEQPSQDQPENTTDQPEQPKPDQPQQEQPSQEKPEPNNGEEQAYPWQEGFDLGDAAREVTANALLPVLGVGDFVADVAGMIGIKQFDSWWDKNSLRSASPIASVVRNLASIILPSMVSGAGLVRLGTWGAKGLQAARGIQLGTRIQKAGVIAANLGADTAVAAVHSSTMNPENLANDLENNLGWQIPWAIRDEDSPDTIWKKNMIENTGIGALAELVAVFFAGKKAQKVLNAQGDEIVVKPTDAVKPDDDAVVKSIDDYEQGRQAVEDDIGVERIRQDPNGEKGYDPFVNVPSEDTARAVPGFDASPESAAVARARISENAGTFNGQQGPVLTPGQKKYYKAADIDGREEILEELNSRISIPKIVDFEGKIDIQKAVDALTEAAQARNGFDASAFRTLIRELGQSSLSLKQGTKIRFVGEEGFRAVSQAKQNLLERLASYESQRASAMLSQSAAEEASNAASALNKIDDFADTSRQVDNLTEALEILTLEERKNRYLSGLQLQLKRLNNEYSRNSPEYTRAYKEMLDDLPEQLTKAQQDARNFTNTFKEIAKKNPERVKPFLKAYDMSNGNIDTIEKLNAYANKLVSPSGTIIDLDPKSPNLFAQAVRSIRYNSVLSGLAPLRAFAGNSMLLALKPVTTLAGSALTGNAAGVKRALWTFGGGVEVFKRAYKFMGDEWRYLADNPDAMLQRSRVDLHNANVDQLEILSDFAEVWKKEGDIGRAGLAKTTMIMHGFNQHMVSRFGLTALGSLDGFVKSMVASMNARANAYDELFAAGGKIDQRAFDAKQQQLYNNAFGADNVIKDDAVKAAAADLTLSVDTKASRAIGQLISHVPAAEAVFMFPRVGINALEMAWSYNPVSALGLSIGRARKVLSANTVESMTAALKEHGIKEFSQPAFDALKSEYIGRQMMGSTVTLGAAMMALQGNLTGTGPEMHQDRKKLEAMGWRPMSFKHPITGEWVSYKGLEPFDSILGLTADIVFQANRVDSSIAEDSLRKLSTAISMNISSKTFLSGFQPLVAFFSGDEAAITRMFAMYGNSLVPWSGARTAISRVVSPQVKDVDADFWSQIKKNNSFLPNDLAEQLDVYTGKPIEGFDPITDGLNNLLPFFKTNPGSEPWREWLINSGWTNLQQYRSNPVTGEPLTGKERQWINNFIGERGRLLKNIKKLMTNRAILKRQQRFLEQKGPQSEWPIKESPLHQALDDLHNDEFKVAWIAYRRSNPEARRTESLIERRNRRLNRGDTQGATQDRESLQELTQMPK
jgi:hypothetical protein